MSIETFLSNLIISKTFSNKNRNIENLPVEVVIITMISSGAGLGKIINVNKRFRCIYNSNKVYILGKILKQTNLMLAIKNKFLDLILLFISKKPDNWSSDIDRGIIESWASGEVNFSRFLFGLKTQKIWIDSLRKNHELFAVMRNFIDPNHILHMGIVKYNIKMVKGAIEHGASSNRTIKGYIYPGRNPRITPLELVRSLAMRHHRNSVKGRKLSSIARIIDH